MGWTTINTTGQPARLVKLGDGPDQERTFTGVYLGTKQGLHRLLLRFEAGPDDEALIPRCASLDRLILDDYRGVPVTLRYGGDTSRHRATLPSASGSPRTLVTLCPEGSAHSLAAIPTAPLDRPARRSRGRCSTNTRTPRSMRFCRPTGSPCSANGWARTNAGPRISAGGCGTGDWCAQRARCSTSCKTSTGGRGPSPPRT